MATLGCAAPYRGQVVAAAAADAIRSVRRLSARFMRSSNGGWRSCREILPQVFLHDHIGRRLVARVPLLAHDAIAAALVVCAEPRQRRTHTELHARHADGASL